MLGGFQEIEFDFVADNPGRHLVPLSPAAAHGFRLHGTIRLRMNSRSLPMQRPTATRYFAGLSRNTFLLAFASLFADISTEMLYPVLPIFLTQTLKASGSIVGLVEGIAQATLNIVQGFSGWLSDKLQRRKPIALGGLYLGGNRQAAHGSCHGVARCLGYAFLIGLGLARARRHVMPSLRRRLTRRTAARPSDWKASAIMPFLGPLIAIATSHRAAIGHPLGSILRSSPACLRS